jgi:hypothetical protein
MLLNLMHGACAFKRQLFWKLVILLYSGERHETTVYLAQVRGSAEMGTKTVADIIVVIVAKR